MIRRTTSTDPAFVALVRGLDADLRARYGELQDTYAPHNVFTTPTAVVAELDGEPVGCGCFKPWDAEAVELKRMFVAADRRGTGIGRALVGALEVWATELGYRAVVLETGTLQHEAIALYEKAGYRRTPAWGPYIDLPASICMRKDLA